MTEKKLSYYQKNRHDPEFRRRIGDKAKLRWHRRYWQDPVFREKERARSRAYYHGIKNDPQKMDARRLGVATIQRSRREKQQEIRRQLQQELGGRCTDCGLDNWRLLDFDHIDPKTKTMNISQQLHLPYDALLREVEKCELRCPNCHRLKTMAQGGHDARIRFFRNPRKRSTFDGKLKMPD